MDKTSDKSRRYKWTLYAGIVLWVIGLVGGLITSGSGGAIVPFVEYKTLMVSVFSVVCGGTTLYYRRCVSLLG